LGNLNGGNETNRIYKEEQKRISNLQKMDFTSQAQKAMDVAQVQKINYDNAVKATQIAEGITSNGPIMTENSSMSRQTARQISQYLYSSLNNPNMDESMKTRVTIQAQKLDQIAAGGRPMITPRATISLLRSELDERNEKVSTVRRNFDDLMSDSDDPSTQSNRNTHKDSRRVALR
jgi:hypothetical protein